MKKVISTVLFLTVLLASLCILTASAEAASGKVGNCDLVLEGGVLTISGNGSMGSGNDWPWGTSFKKIVIKEGVTEIGIGAFYQCTSLVEVELPSTLKVIGLRAFEGCNSLENITLPEKLKKIDHGAFSRCSKLEKINIPKSVSEISGWCFVGCYRLNEITVDEENPNFCGVDGVLFTEDMTTLVKYPGGNGRDTYTVPNTVKVIGDKAFEYAYSIRYIYLPDGLTRIGIDAFSNTWLYDNEFNNVKGCFYIDKCLILFRDKDAAECYVRPSTRLIADGAFVACRNLKSIELPDSLEYIGTNTFSWCSSLESVSASNSLKWIGEYAFFDCTELKNVYYRGSDEDYGEIDIDQGNESLTGAEWSYNACIGTSEHKFGEYEITKDTSCAEYGEKMRKCSVCERAETETIPALEHTCETWSVSVAPTCTESGEERCECSVCGGVVTRTVDAIGHSIGEWKTDVLPTCEAEGTEKRVCTNCTETETRKTAAMGHSFGEPTVIKEPTHRETGIKEYRCNNCDVTKTESIPLLTGMSTDEIAFTVIAAVLLLAVIAVGAVLIIKAAKK